MSLRQHTRWFSATVAAAGLFALMIAGCKDSGSEGDSNGNSGGRQFVTIGTAPAGGAFV